MEEKKKIPGLPTTIIFGILLTAAIIAALILAQIDISGAIQNVVS